MPPKWVSKVFGSVLLIGAIGLVLFVGFTMMASLVNDNNEDTRPGPYPTLDVTRVAEFTPTWGPGDVDNLVATVMPTPRAFITLPDVEAMNAALVGKQSLLAVDYIFASEFRRINVSWYCSDLKLGDWSLPGSNIGAAKLIEGQWRMGVSLSNINFTMEQGSPADPIYGNDGAGPTIETKYNGILVVDIRSFGIDGPTYYQGNEWIFSVGEPIPGYQLWLISRTIFTGQDLIEEKRVYVTNMAERLVKLETIVPNGSDENLMAMYDTFVASFSEPGEGHLYDTLLAIFEPMAREHGYAGIESIRLIMPPAPNSIYGWMGLNGMPLIPTDYPAVFSDSTCPSPQPSPADIEALENGGE